MFLNAGQSFENSSQRVLIVLVLHCYGNGNESGASAAPVEHSRPLGASLHLRGEWYTLMGASALAVPRLRVWGITSPWKLEES